MQRSIESLGDYHHLFLEGISIQPLSEGGRRVEPGHYAIHIHTGS